MQDKRKLQGNINGWSIVIRTQTEQGDEEFALGAIMLQGEKVCDGLIVVLEPTRGGQVIAEWDQVVCAGEEPLHMVDGQALLASMVGEVAA